VPPPLSRPFDCVHPHRPIVMPSSLASRAGSAPAAASIPAMRAAASFPAMLEPVCMRHCGAPHQLEPVCMRHCGAHGAHNDAAGSVTNPTSALPPALPSPAPRCLCARVPLSPPTSGLCSSSLPPPTSSSSAAPWPPPPPRRHSQVSGVRLGPSLPA
jgi:hypothetical protein